MNRIKLKILQSSDGAIELGVEVRAGHFHGCGTAWFDSQVVLNDLASFEQFPISATNPPMIAGGYWSDDGTQLKEEHVHISLRAINGVGALVMTVRAFAPDATRESQGLGCGVQCDYLVSYEGVVEFSNAVRQLMADQAGEVEFEKFEN